MFSTKTTAAGLSIISNSLLVILKVVVGLLMGSVSVLSEGIHSGVDLLAALIAFFSIRAAAKPADEEHAFGHGKIENVSGTIEALLIFLAAGWIIYEAIDKIRTGTGLESIDLGIGLMAGSAVLNMTVKGNQRSIEKQLGSLKEIKSFVLKEKKKDWLTYRINSASKAELGELIFRTAVKKKWALKELHQEMVSLEDVFIKLTSADEGK